MEKKNTKETTTILLLSNDNEEKEKPIDIVISDTLKITPKNELTYLHLLQLLQNQDIDIINARIEYLKEKYVGIKPLSIGKVIKNE